jgi:sugar phosphate isomerase/epimerase
MLAILERLIAEGNYQALETGVTADPRVTRALRAGCGRGRIRLTQWLTGALASENLRLNEPDSSRRALTVERCRQWIAFAAEAGGDAVAVISGIDHGPGLREESLRCLAEALRLLCAEMKQHGMRLLLEPLDRMAHKRQLIGTTADAATLIRALRSDGFDAAIAWDSAHTALNGEDLKDSLLAARELVGQVHLSNAILEPSDPMYGDFHMPLGPPGFMTLERAADVVRIVCGHIAIPEYGMPFTAEMRSAPGDDVWGKERESYAFLDRAVELGLEGRRGR